MNILIVKLSAIGDVVLSLPFLAAMRRSYPRARISWVVEEAAAEVLIGHPLLDRVIVWRRQSWIRTMKTGRIPSATRVMLMDLRALRQDRYDLVVDLQGLAKSGLVALLSGGRRRVGFDRNRELSHWFVNDRLPPYDLDRHALLRYLDVAAYLGASIREVDFHLPMDQSAAVTANNLLAADGRAVVVINPGAKWPSKLWPLNYWQELVEMLAARPDLHIVLTGSPDEQAINWQIAKDRANILDLTGRTSLRVLGEIFRQAKMIVCPDTGPMHLGAAVGTPVVALFGPTAPWRTGPFGPDHVVIRTNMICSPCYWKKCPEPKCMTFIEPRSVVRAIDQVLSKHAV